MQVECPAVTPEVVLQASGHVERFTDLMVTDVVTGDCHRADHLLEHALEALMEDSKNPLKADDKKACLSSTQQVLGPDAASSSAAVMEDPRAVLSGDGDNMRGVYAGCQGYSEPSR